MMPLRVALVGALEGVDVFEIVFYIGKKETIGRINALIQHQA
jgi:glutamyl-tRNA synthetase